MSGYFLVYKIKKSRFDRLHACIGIDVFPAIFHYMIAVSFRVDYTIVQCKQAYFTLGFLLGQQTADQKVKISRHNADRG